MQVVQKVSEREREERTRFVFNDLKNALLKVSWRRDFKKQTESLKETSGDSYKKIMRNTSESLAFFSLILKDGDALDLMGEHSDILNLGGSLKKLRANLELCDRKILIQYQNFILSMCHLIMQETFGDD